MNPTVVSLIKRAFHIPLMDQMMVSATNFLMTVVIIRLLGLDVFGVMTIMLLVVLFFQSIQNAYILSPIQTLYHQQDNPQDYARHSVTTQCIFGLISAIAAVVFLIVFRHYSDIHYDDSVILPVFFLVLSRQIQEFIRRYGFTIATPIPVFVNDIIAYGAYVPVLLILHMLDMLTLQTALWSLTLLTIGACIHGLSFLPKPAYNHKTKTVALEHARYSKWLVGTASLQWLSGDYFIFMTSVIMGTTSVGILRAVERIMAVLNILILTIENIYPSKAATAYKNTYKAGLWACVISMYKREGLAILAISIILCLFAEPMLTLIYGENMREHAYLLQFFALAYMFTFIRLPLHIILRTCHRTRPIFASFCVTAVFSLITAKWLITQYGLNGAAIGVVITRILTAFWYAAAVWHSDKKGFIKQGEAI